jgi:hypothetical protein
MLLQSASARLMTSSMMCLFIVWAVIMEKREAVIRSRMKMKSEILNLKVVNNDFFIIRLNCFVVE